MLKKILLSCLTAAIILPFPLSANAANTSQTPTILPLSLAAADKSLSPADLNSIKKEVDGLIKALNERSSKKYMGHYSRKYQSQSPNGDTINYDTMALNIDTGIKLLKSFGIKLNNQDIKIAGAGRNKATVEVIYKMGLTKDSPFANSPESDKLKDKPYGMLLTFEKTNGRWLIISSENALVSGAESLAATAQKTVTPITSQDKQTFSNLFKRHLDALNRKNLNDYLATLDPKAPQYDKTKQETAQLFKEYTLKYTIKSVKVLSINKQEAVVEMVATVKKISGGGFKDSQMTTTNLLKKTNGKWRIYGTSINSLTDLQAQK